MNNNTTEDNTNELSNNKDNTIYLPPPSCEHSYASLSLLNVCEGCNSKTSLIDSLIKKVNFLNISLKQLNQKQVNQTKKLMIFSCNKVKTDKK